MKDGEFDFEKDISIDKYRLDQECVTHSVMYYRYNSLAADAKNSVAVLSDDLKLIMGEENIRIRNNFIKSEIKFTEAVINSEVEKSDSVKTAREELRHAELSLSRIEAGVRAFEHRKSQLDNLVKLYIAGYFSTPNSSGQVRDTVNEAVSNDIRKKLKKTHKTEE
jgi:hypothetical protein